MNHPFLTRLERGPVLADGAMGTYLYERGIPFDRSFDLLNLAEAAIAIEAARSVTDHHPLVLQMTFTEDGRTLYGAYPEDVARDVDGRQVDVLGANCSVGPQKLLEIVERLRRKSRLPISVMP